jgi:hypothetical protein
MQYHRICDLSLQFNKNISWATKGVLNLQHGEVYKSRSKSRVRHWNSLLRLLAFDSELLKIYFLSRHTNGLTSISNSLLCLYHISISDLKLNLANRSIEMTNANLYAAAKIWLPLCPSGQSSAADLQVRIWFRALPDFLRSIRSGTGSTQPREYHWGAIWKK